ncbi:MAG: HupE/UreJ family protein [Thermoanaerobaculia bacterium]
MSRAIFCAVIVSQFIAGMAAADIVQPVNVQAKEQEPNTFLVQWQVPKLYPVQAMPEPVLPDSCRTKGERVLQDQPAAWLNRQVYRCPDGLAGHRVGIHYRLVNAGQTTVMRVDFLSGEQLVHLLAEGEMWWDVPEVDAGLLAKLWPNVRRAVMQGVRHFLASWVHIAFWLAICLVGGVSTSVRLVTAFSAAQVVAVILSSGLGTGLPIVLAEGGVAIAAVLLASEALRPAGERRQLMGIAIVAGLLHGLGLGAMFPAPPSFAGLEWLYLLLAVVGMDAVLLTLALAGAWFGQLVADRSWSRSLRRGLGVLVGGTAVAAALVVLFSNPVVEAEAGLDTSRLPVATGASNAAGMPGSRRVAQRTSQAAVQSFLAVEAFEVRHEVLVRLSDVAEQLDLGSTEILQVEGQGQVKDRLQELVLPLATATIDGEIASPIVDRVDFLTVGTQGVLPRPEPVPEIVSEAFAGVTLVYLTPRTPEQVTVRWESFEGVLSEIPATVSDPEFSQSVTLTAEDPELEWQNNLSEDPIPVVNAVAIEPMEIPIPLLALPFLIVSMVLLFSALWRERSATRFALARVALAIGLLVAPIGEMAFALPSSLGSAPSTGEARRILAGVLPNVYRAFEFREESDAYDRLAVSVTGDTLSEIYLEHRRSLEMEERGGARARVETVEVPEVRQVSPADNGGFVADAVWVVGGTVTHFGHRHFRQNRYDARVSLVPVDNTWKIHTIELFDEERIR